MKQTKFIVLVAGILGIVACFLPYASAMGHTMKLWDLHNAKQGMTEGLINGPKQIYVILGAFGVIALMGLLSLKRMMRAQAIVAILAGAAAMACTTVHDGISKFEGVSTGVGGKLVFIAAVLAILGGLIGVAKPEPGR